MKKEKVSNAVIRRLPRYFRHVDDLHLSGVVRISSSALGAAMGLTASQIRQDLSCFGEFGQQGYGYNVEKLRNELAEILGMNHNYKLIIMGVGHLGHTLIQNFPFKGSGFELLAAFDVSSEVVGQTLGGVPVYHVDDLAREVRRLRPHVAVLTTPKAVASSLANELVDLGVTGLWNFTNIELTLDQPEKAVVENIHFADSLLALSFMISNSDGRDR